MEDEALDMSATIRNLVAALEEIARSRDTKSAKYMAFVAEEALRVHHFRTGERGRANGS